MSSAFDPNSSTPAPAHNPSPEAAPPVVGRAELKARALKIDAIQRHIFLCCEQSKATTTTAAAAPGGGEMKMTVGSKQKGGNVCCSVEQGAESWEYLKRRSRELNAKHSPFHIGRTKANCLQICHDGPIAVVYPEGVWYKRATPEALELILTQHMVRGIPVPQFLLHPAPG